MENTPLQSVRMTFFGTTTWLLDDGETQILLDAHLTRPNMLRAIFGKIETDKTFVDGVLRQYPMDRLRAIFASHSHYDHVLDAAYIAAKTGAVLCGSRSTQNVGLGGALPKAQTRVFAAGETVRVGAFEVTVLPSVHSKPTILNNDLGVEIPSPLAQPARMRDYTEGGSFDFWIRHSEKTLLVRPSCNFIPGALKDISADTILLGIGTMGRESGEFFDRFYAETVGSVRPQRIIPIHWDNFFRPLRAPMPYQTRIADNVPRSLEYLRRRTDEDGVRLEIVDAFETTEM